MNLNLNDIIELCRAEALAGKLYPTDTSDWRWFCRAYSKTFHTPLIQVLEMDPEHVILAVLEDGLDHRRLKKREDAAAVIEDLRRLEDPDYDKHEAEEFEDFVEGVEEWDNQRLSDGKPVPKKRVKEEKPQPIPEHKKEGFINLSHLAKEEEDDSQPSDF